MNGEGPCKIEDASSAADCGDSITVLRTLSTVYSTDERVYTPGAYSTGVVS